MASTAEVGINLTNLHAVVAHPLCLAVACTRPTVATLDGQNSHPNNACYDCFAPRKSHHCGASALNCVGVPGGHIFPPIDRLCCLGHPYRITACHTTPFKLVMHCNQCNADVRRLDPGTTLDIVSCSCRPLPATVEGTDRHRP